MSFRAAAVQLNTQDDKERNLERALELIEQAASRGADLVALPENFNYLGSTDAQVEHAEPIPGPTIASVADTARTHGVHVLAGSILESVDGSDKVYNTSVLLDPEGNEVLRYRKLHLFDIDVEGQVHANESAIMLPGTDLAVVDTKLGSIGLTICYDLRFPELYRSLALKGARVILAPSAFTLYTGKDHWELLVRARAVENAVFMVAPAQIGSYPPGEHCFGDSMIVDPWGTVIARATERETVVVADVDASWQDTVRASLPALACRRPDVYDL